jgi:SOS-response transcriptional repressors (RecA-mediated autopeptidases)
MSILSRIKTIGERQGLNLTQIERGSGLNTRTLYKWDKNSPSVDKVLAVANFLNVSLSWLITGAYENHSFDPDFVKRYEMLSELEKDKIDYFMEICLIKTSILQKEETPIIYRTPETQTSTLKEAPSYYQTKQDTIAILGYVAAGEPIEGISIPLGYIPDTVNADYALIAKGHSMEPVILDGEYIFVKKCESLDYGDIGIFYINGDVTCKKYHPQPDRLVLQSLNPDFKPFKYSLNDNYDFKIQGKVILTSTQKNRFS